MARYTYTERQLGGVVQRKREPAKRPLIIFQPSVRKVRVKPLISFEQFASRTAMINDVSGKRKICLLIPAHNETLVIQNTIRSAMASGLERQDIFVVNDNSTDDTAELAIELLGDFNVLTVGRSGKGLAIKKASRAFMLSRRYEWIHIADADGAFDRHYFETFQSQLRSDKAAATGYLRSSRGTFIGKFRAFEYTLGMELTRRVQVMLGTLQVIPGATSCIRSDVFDKLDFDGGTLTEDYDVTLQIHRQKLGSIQFIPGATAFTQDPQNFRDFHKQITRWYKGGVQCMLKHDIGSKFRRIDMYIGYQIFQNFLFLGVLFFVMPVIAYLTHSLFGFTTLFLWDAATMFAMCVLIAAKAKRWDILNAFPLIYGLKWVNTYAYTKAILIAMFKPDSQTKNPSRGAWTSPERAKA